MPKPVKKRKPQLVLVGGKGVPTVDDIVYLFEKLTGKKATPAELADLRTEYAALSQEKRLPVPPQPKRPTDPNRAAHSLIKEHMARQAPAAPTPDDFGSQFSAHMAKLGAKGGKVSGAKRMEMPKKERIAIAKKAAAVRWSKRKP
jgi:hypothetical protein